MKKGKIAKILISAGIMISVIGVTPTMMANAQPVSKKKIYSVDSNNSNIQKAVVNTTIQLSNGVANKYDMAVIIGENGGYYNIITQYGATGSIPKSDLTIVKSGIGNQLIKLNEMDHIVHVKTNLNVRQQPDVHSGLLTTLTNGTNVQVTGQEGEWYRINVNNQVGYVYNDFMKQDEKVQNNVVSNSKPIQNSNSKEVVNKNTQVAKNTISSNSKVDNKNTSNSKIEVDNKNISTSKVEPKKENNQDKNKSNVIEKYNIAGTWKVTNQAASPIDTNGENQILTGKMVVIEPNVFSIGNVTIKNPTYSVEITGNSGWFGNPGDTGHYLNDNDYITVLKVNSKEFVNNCTIILGQGKIQVLNSTAYVFNAERTSGK